MHVSSYTVWKMFILTVKLLWDKSERSTGVLEVNAWCNDSVKSWKSGNQSFVQ